MADEQNKDGDVNKNLLGGAGDDVEIPEKFYQPEFIEVDKDGKKEKVSFDFDGLKIPEKLVVKNDDGSVNHEKTAKRILATTKKTVTSYSALEKRLGSHELPPEKEDGYKLDYSKFPEGVKIEADREKSFLKSCHAMGMTNKQVQGVMDRYADLISEGLQLQANQKQTVTDALKKEWGDNFEANLGLAQKAFLVYADEKDKANIDQFGNNPAVLRLLSKIGKEIGGEDREPIGGSGASGEDIEVIMRSEAYWNEKHPEHKLVKQKVQAYYQKKYAA